MNSQRVVKSAARGQILQYEHLLSAKRDIDQKIECLRHCARSLCLKLPLSDILIDYPILYLSTANTIQTYPR